MGAMFARVLGFAVVLGPVVVLSSTSGPARAAGSIEGTIRLAGPAPAVAARPIAKDANVCGDTATAESVVVGKAGALANVVVSVTDARFAGTPTPSAGASIDQRRCRYAPHVQAVAVGTPLAVMNNDAILHNVHASEAGAGGAAPTVFNLAMPIKGQKLPVPMRKPGLLRLQCDAGHGWMNAWIYVFAHPYFAVTDDNGAFVIDGVPAGDHVVELWHEPVNGQGPGTRTTARIKVVDGKRARLDLTLHL
jgi:plastocyanin